MKPGDDVGGAGLTETRGQHASVWARAAPLLSVYAIAQIALDWIRLPAGASAAGVNAASLLASVAIIVLASACLAVMVRPAPDRRSVVQVAVAGAALWAVGLGLSWWITRTQVPAGPPDGWRPSTPVRFLSSVAGTSGDLGILCLGAGIGCAVAGIIRDRNILLPAGVFAAFADWFMVRYGTVHHALQSEGGQRIVQAMSAQVPALHQSLSAVTLGMADFVFLAFFFACASRFQMNFRATYVLLTILLSALLFGIRWLGAFPAVAPMAIGFLAVNGRHFRLSRSELQATGVVFLLMAGLAVAYLYVQG